MIAQQPATRQAHKAAYLAALIDAASPFLVGVIHAEKGEVCDPSDIYCHDGDIAEFVEGYRSVMPSPQPPRRLLAAGRIQGGERTITGVSLFDSSEVVEHTVNAWAEGDAASSGGAANKVMAEVRVNGRLLFRRAFEGDNAQVEAAAWCDATVPMADSLSIAPKPVAVPADFAGIDDDADDAAFAAIFAPAVEDEYEYEIEDDADWIRGGC